MSAPARIAVALEGRDYDVLVGHGLHAHAADAIAALAPYSAYYVIADEAIAEAIAAPLHQALRATGKPVHALRVPSGEASKSFAQLQTVLEAILATQPDRRCCLIAVGGGVMGDLVGLAASLLLRGVDFVQIPTTVLAMVDSSVGGKTAVNCAAGKNLVGAFYQPRLVLADLDSLRSLPAREWRAGYAEVVKYGALGDAPFFDWLEAHGTQALAGETDALQHMVAHCVAAKAAVVAADERESGQRALLNLGHTLGHALEATLGYDGRLLHGEAVAIGMVFAFRLAQHLGMLRDASTTRLEAHLRACGLPTHPHDIVPHWDTADLVARCAGDKKAANGKLTFVLPRALGQCEVVHPVAADAVLGCLQNWLSEGA